MSDTPPAYNEAKAREFEKELAKAFLDDSVHGQFVLDIGTSFSFRYSSRREFEDLGLGDEDGHPLEKTWAEFQERLLELLAQSKTLAGEIADSCDDYLTTIVKPAARLSTECEMNLESIEALLKEIGAFLKEGDEMEAKASIMRDGFSNLASDIKSFREGFEKYGGGRRTSNQTYIDHIEEEINNLKRVLDDILDISNYMHSILKPSNIPDHQAHTWNGWPWGFHRRASYYYRLLPAGFSGYIYTYDKIRADQKQEDGLQAEDNMIDTIRTGLAQLGKGQIESVLNGSEFCRALWAEITSDVHSIRKYLEKIKTRADGGNAEDYPPSVYSFLKTGTTLNYGLSRGLKLYKLGVERAVNIKYTLGASI
ncbi:hypothetical protein DL93DRAFT_2211972 [Clavulina sp. PMI_390]|nr:hypothetical protein DL93DRAFT_2211972 [Clavulina sp. PMI_390]